MMPHSVIPEDRADNPWPPAVRPVSEERLDAAYATTTDEHRAWLKTTLALVRTVYGEAPGASLMQTRSPRLGFGHQRTCRPADWVLAVLAPEFAAAPRLAAALMSARLAGVGMMLALWSAPLPPVLGAAQADVLTALQLAGVDEMAELLPSPPAAPPAAPSGWAAVLDCLPGTGRVVCFGYTPDAALAALLAQRHIAHQYDASPRLMLPAICKELEPTIRWAHPDAQLTPYTNNAGPEPAPTAVYALHGEAEHVSTNARLVLEADMAGCWIHPDMTPEFFTQQHLAVFTA